MEILTALENNIRKRAKLLNECALSDNLKNTTFTLCKKDILFFFKFFVVTDRNSGLIPEVFGNIIPFIPFEYQEEFLVDAWDAIQMGQLPLKDRTQPTNIFSEKSRQMGFSWLFAGLQVYAYMFHNMKSLYISMKADEVDKSGDMKSHFEKIRFIIRGLPNWMLPEGLEKSSGTEHNKYMVISRADGTGNIKGESANPNAGRGGTIDFAIYDEMAFMQYAQAINMSVSSSTPCSFYNSTPNGEGNEYYRMKLLALPVDNKGKPQNIIRYHRCHRTENPLYTQDWYNWRIKGMTQEGIARELEIDYNTAVKGRVYENFIKGNHNNTYRDELPLYVTIDNSHGGIDPHALIIIQQDGHYWNILDTCEFNCSVTDMAKIIARVPEITMTNRQLEFYNKYILMKRAIFIADPYDTHSTLNQSTIFEEYQKVGIFLNIPQNRNKKDQIMQTKANIHRLRVNENCTDFISAISNARYPDKKENSTSTKPNELPIHDWTSHYRTALEYFVTFILENNLIETKKERIAREVINPITGEMKIVYS